MILHANASKCKENSDGIPSETQMIFQVLLTCILSINFCNISPYTELSSGLGSDNYIVLKLFMLKLSLNW